MGLRVSFELDDSDLQHFRLIMREARKSAALLSAAEIVASAKDLLHAVDSLKVPRFVAERLERLSLMIRMLEDHEWRLPAVESTRVLNALAYFRDPEDLIPDHVPGLGFLDDAIMIELVARELRHELEAYRDFCEFRERIAPRTTIKPRSTDMRREQWLAERRKELLSRMRRRRKKAAEHKDNAPRLL
ncbi:MAG: YkvA family protein [Woeseia sp.]